MSLRHFNVFILCTLVVSGLLLGTVSSAAEPARHKRDAESRLVDRVLKSLLRTTSHHHRAHTSGSSSGSSTRAALKGFKGRRASTVSTAGPVIGVADKGRANKPTPPPEECGHGSIAYIKCWLDEAGFVTGLAFESRAGTRGKELCNTAGPHTDGGFLYDGEKILEIISCRGPGGGLTHLEFHTDGARLEPLTCGHGSKSFSSLFKAALASKGLETAAEAESEAELEAELEAEAEAPNVEALEWCESLTQGHAPQGAYEISAKGPRQSTKVQYDLKEMYPIGGLTARCSPSEGIMELSNTCWKSQDSQPDVQGPVLVEAWVQLNDGPAEIVRDPVQQEQCDPAMCEDKDTNRQLSAWVATALPHILEEVGTRDVWVKHSVLSCKPCSDKAGTLFQVALALYTQKGELQSVEYTLKAMMAWPEKNMCKSKDIQIGCAQEGAGMLRLSNVWVKTSGTKKQAKQVAAAAVGTDDLEADLA